MNFVDFRMKDIETVMASIATSWPDAYIVGDHPKIHVPIRSWRMAWYRPNPPCAVKVFETIEAWDAWDDGRVQECAGQMFHLRVDQNGIEFSLDEETGSAKDVAVAACEALRREQPCGIRSS